MPSPASTRTDRAQARMARARRRAAAGIVAEIADRLAEPERVTEIADVPDNVMRYPGDPQPVWNPLLLSDGHPGVALLFAELAAATPEPLGGERAQVLARTHESRRRAHAHLAAAPAGGLRLLPQSLFGGMVALAFAGHAAATTSGGYGRMLAELDGHITDQVRQRARADRERARAGAPVGAWSRYDVLGGTAGIGRYLLARHESAAGPDERQAAGIALTEVLESLVAVATAEDIERHGTRLPAWWVAEELEHGLAEHVNLGLAHGVCGPLALLAVAWRAGFRVERQDEAIERIMALLSRWRTTDEYGPRWPHLISMAHVERGAEQKRGRDSWCYGVAGAARAVHLAGAALDRADWRADAHAALSGALAAASDELICDSALCHGWAGLLHIVSRMAHDTGVPDYHVLADGLAGRVIDGYDPESPFGFRYRHPLAARPLDRPGFLEGAAGIALALHTYATGNPPATSWDSALLVS